MTSKDEITAAVKEIFKKTLKIEPERLQTATTLKGDLKLDSGIQNRGGRYCPGAWL